MWTSPHLSEPKLLPSSSHSLHPTSHHFSVSTTSHRSINMWPSPKVAYLLLWAHSLLVSGSPIDSEAADAAVLAKRQCPQIHIFGARETTVAPGYGTAGVVVDLIKGAYPGATSEAITYPACGGQSSCGGVQYGDSARQGTDAVAQAVNSFNQRCPSTQLVLVGYSQVPKLLPLTKSSEIGELTSTRVAKSWTTPSAAAPILALASPAPTLRSPPPL